MVEGQEVHRGNAQAQARGARGDMGQEDLGRRDGRFAVGEMLLGGGVAVEADRFGQHGLLDALAIALGPGDAVGADGFVKEDCSHCLILY